MNAAAQKKDLSASFAGLIILVLMLPVSGCMRYCIGPNKLFQPNIRTVYVPMFQSESYRRNLGEWLTEAVVKELEMRSQYKVVHTPDADSVLYGHLISENKQAITEDVNDNPRDIGTDMVVEVRWVDRAGQTVLRSAAIPIDVLLVSSAHFVPEGGQSMTSDQQRMITSLARQIVNQMEVGW
jgi:hypothetical protein